MRLPYCTKCGALLYGDASPCYACGDRQEMPKALYKVWTKARGLLPGYRRARKRLVTMKRHAAPEVPQRRAYWWWDHGVHAERWETPVMLPRPKKLRPRRRTREHGRRV